ncbi:hypothetical protein AB0H42_35300, partial [Nocardia sp. NPDC050799]|uniref:hypothetical protein n=1 Tax=Nocardia sp. NPDC050799 TaxID=3154842 RepID=UPI003402D5C0
DSSDTTILSAEAGRLSLSDHRPAHKIADSPAPAGVAEYPVTSTALMGVPVVIAEKPTDLA